MKFGALYYYPLGWRPSQHSRELPLVEEGEMFTERRGSMEDIYADIGRTVYSQLATHKRTLRSIDLIQEDTVPTDEARMKVRLIFE